MKRFFNLEWASILKGALLAGIGAAATYLLQAFGGYDFGEYQTYVAAALAVLANIVRKYFAAETPLVDE